MPNLQIALSNQLAKNATKTALSLSELIGTMKSNGMSNVAIRQTLLSDLNSGGQLFGSFKNQLKNTVKSGVERSSNDAANSSFTSAGVKQFQWVSVGDKSVCQDCEPRHGETGTLEFFQTVGLPASGFSVCQTNCRCKILPVNYKGENLDEPLIRKKLKEKTFEERLNVLGIGFKRQNKIRNISLTDNPEVNNEIVSAFEKLKKDGYKFNIDAIDNKVRSNDLAYAGYNVNQNIFSINPPKNIREKLKKDVERGFHPKGSDTIKSIIDHEMAHYYTARSIKYYEESLKTGVSVENVGKELSKVRERYIEKWDSLKKQLIKADRTTESGEKLFNEIFEEMDSIKISNYANENLDEFVAESFSMYRNNRNPSPYAIEVGKIIEGMQ